MADLGGTGHCATVTFLALDGSDPNIPEAFIGRLNRIGEINMSAERVENNDICTSIAKYLPGDIAAHDEVEMQCAFLTTVDMPAINEKYVVVIEWPIRVSSNNVKAKFSGQGFITRANIGESAAGERVEAALTVSFDGENAAGDGDGPLFEKETTNP